ncbi:MAG: alpha/beta hydrolase [Clostridium sp.]|nr:alpha/beta hydrolase [Clostridium sp.]
METGVYKIWEENEYHYEYACGFVPKLNSYLHEDGEKRPCVLVAPGGAYMFVSPSEGELVALKFYEMGYQAFVLTYTVNPWLLAPLKKQSLKDISRAVRYIRKNAEDFRVEADKLAVCGFSAGGHLCASLCVHFEDVLEEGEGYKEISNRPDAAILSYPVITSGEKAHRGSFDALLGEDASEEELKYMSLEKQVTENTPPCFVWATMSDQAVPVENTLMFMEACREKGVPCACHIFSDGEHGLSLADEDWANWKKQSDYTEEQRVRVKEKIKSGELTVPASVQKAIAEEEKAQATPRAAQPEVTVWPKLADDFLRKML